MTTTLIKTDCKWFVKESLTNRPYYGEINFLTYEGNVTQIFCEFFNSERGNCSSPTKPKDEEKCRFAFGQVKGEENEQ